MKGLKQGISSGYHSTAIATNYQLRSSKDDFPHRDELVKERVQKYKAFKSHGSAKAALSSYVSGEKSTVPTEKRVADTFSAAVGSAESAKDSMQHLSDLFRVLETHRATLVATLTVIEDEWKAVDKSEFNEANKQKEKIDRSLTELIYYEEKKLESEKQKAHHEYNEHCHAFVEATTKAIEIYEVKYIEWNGRVLDAIKQYHSACLDALGGGGGGSSSISVSSPVRAAAAPSPRPAAAPTPAPAPAPVPQAPTYPRARALYPFQPNNAGELGFNPGDILNIQSQNGAWWQAELYGKTGLIPSNYVELI